MKRATETTLNMTQPRSCPLPARPWIWNLLFLLHPQLCVGEGGGGGGGQRGGGGWGGKGRAGGVGGGGDLVVVPCYLVSWRRTGKQGGTHKRGLRNPHGMHPTNHC